jgi:2-succinyl-5-enolpyruvyl-6-hydroxy-3-cyclohexene-1-carboxylate synthase
MSEHCYTDEQNAQIVLALLKAYGIRKVVASPGTTNIPITGSIQNDSFFQVWSAADERSAAYIACGLAAESGEAVALSCTGATASRNYLPGLTEAYYRKLPVIAITSTAAFSEVGNLLPQSIDRSSISKDVARISVFLSTVKDADDFATCEHLAGKAILEALRHGCGPVHINLETCYKGTFNTRELPKVRVVRRITQDSAEFPVISPSAKVAVFIGSHKAFSKGAAKALEDFAKTRNVAVFCDHTSSYKGFGRVLSALPCSQSSKAEITTKKPDLIIHIGEVSGDYPTLGFLRNIAPVWRVNEDGEIRDKFKRLEYVFEMSEEFFFRRYSGDSKGCSCEYPQSWNEYDVRIRASIPELPFSNPWIASVLSSTLPHGCVLHFGILNSLRCWNFFEVDASIETASNVGGFGIDGCVSTLIGASLVDRTRLHFGVLGDLAFFYDLNSLGNRHVGSNLRILLVNNGGGGEFKLFSHIGSQFGEQTGDFIAATRHYGNKSPDLARHYAEDLGFKYLCANGKEEFLMAMKEFVSPCRQDKPVLFECFTDMKEEADAIEALEHLDVSVSSDFSARRFVGRILPSPIKDIIKKAIGK